MSNIETTTPAISTFSPLISNPAALSSDVPDYHPGLLAQLGLGSTNQPRYYSTLPQNISQFQSKYSRLGPALSTYPPAVRNALIQYDASRVASGAKPLGDAETIGAVQTAATNTPFTPLPERKLLNIAGNTRSDLQSIIGSIPRLPTALYHELTSLGQIGSYFNAAQEAGQSPLTALASAPGIRLIPGTYTLGNIAKGTAGLKELVTHPLFTALDILPYASEAAKATAVGREAVRLADEAGTTARPLPALLTRRLTEQGPGFGLEPNALGAAGLAFKRSTRIGQAFEEYFGKVNRDIMARRNLTQQDVVNQLQGLSNQSDDLARLANDAYTSATRHGIPAEREPILFDYATNGDPQQYATLPPHELAYINELRDHIAAFGERGVASETLGKFTHDGFSEYYPIAQFRTLETARGARDLALTKADLARSITSPTADPSSYLQSALDAVRTSRSSESLIGAGIPSSTRKLAMLQAGEKSASEIRLLVRSNIKALDAAGYDTSALERAQTLAHKTGDWSSVESALTKSLDQGLTPRPILPLSDIANAISKYRRSDRLADRLAVAIEDGKWTRVTKTIEAIQARYGPSAIPEFSDFTFVDSLRRHRDISRFLEHNIPDPFREAARATTDFESKFSSTPPARFHPLIKAETVRRVTQIAADYAHATTPDAVARVTDAVLHKAWSTLPEEDWAKIYYDTEADVVNTWRQMRESGLDPLFVHNVHPSQAHTLEATTVAEVPTRVSQVKERAIDATPGIKNLHVAVSGQGVELLSRRASEEFAQYVAGYGQPLAQIRDAYRPQAERIIASNPTLDYETALDRAIAKDWTKFDPESAGYNWGGPTLNQITQDEIMLPNAIARNLKRIHDPRSILNGTFDPFTRLFRMSVIGLSPRTQLYNILGGAVMLGGETGPRAFKFAREAWDMVRHPETIQSRELSSIIGQQAKAFEELDKTSQLSRADTLARYAHGQTLRRWWDEVQSAKKFGTVKDAFGRVVNKSYEINGLIDDWYRAMAYLSGKDRALTRGLTSEAAERAGVELTRKVLMDWVSMTSMERSIMKSIFPFYGFMRHAIGYVFRYPIDHPLRAEIISKLAAAEVADNKDVLPSRFLGLLGLGVPSRQSGKQAFLNLAPVNPFNDVAHMVTLQGALGATNPVINGVLQSLGINNGQTELYPTLRYDAESGRLTASHPNPLLSILSSTVPQTDLLTSILGFNTQFRDTLHRDPAAAIRSLASAGGLPILWRQYNVPLEEMRAEVARQNAAQEVQQEAVKTGNWTNALRYPSLRDYFAKVANLPPDVAILYRANTANPASLREMLMSIPTGPGTGAPDA